MGFDDVIDRRGTLSQKWDGLERNCGVSPKDGLAMWVADTDFAAPPFVLEALRDLLDLGVFGYMEDYRPYKSSIQWWMKNRHGWPIETDWIFTTDGLVNAISLLLDTFTQPGDGVVLFTPVYHSFARAVRAANRVVVECPLDQSTPRATIDFAAADAKMTGRERVLIFCSPHNPGGQVWNRDELQAVADFAHRHDLLLISDEIHHDLVYPGHTHTPMSLVDPAIRDRLIMLTATSKTFNIAGMHIGNVIIEDDALRARFRDRMSALRLSPNLASVHMATAAYSPAGADWVDELIRYLDGNRQLFDAGVNAIPGVRSVPLEATFLAWVDFSGTGMEPDEFTRRVRDIAKIGANLGPTFGTGGKSYLRFNFGMARSRIEEAVDRLQSAFSDLQ